VDGPVPITLAPPSSSPPAGATVNVTGTTCGDPDAPAAETVTLPVCVPGASPAALTETETLAGAVPLAGATDSQAASSLAA
jgi:hypothetical protein